MIDEVEGVIFIRGYFVFVGGEGGDNSYVNSGWFNGRICDNSTLEDNNKTYVTVDDSSFWISIDSKTKISLIRTLAGLMVYLSTINYGRQLII